MRNYLFLVLGLVITSCSGTNNPVALPQLTIVKVFPADKQLP